MKILILGSGGMLGSECKDVLGQDHDVISPDKKEMNIISWDGVIQNFQEISPDVVLNCAGFTDIEDCETEDFAVRKINIEGPRNLAQGSARFECKLIHMSCGDIFDGRKMMPQPYFEDDTSNPISAYGKSKVDSEVAIRENSPNYIIVRGSWLYGINGRNFVKSILEQAVRKPKIIRVAEDRFGSPTWTYRLALQIRELLDKDGRGTYHATAEGYCSQLEYARHIVHKLGIKASIEPYKITNLRTKARRPSNCLLENRRLKSHGINVMHNWKKDLDIFLEKFGAELIKEAKAKKS
jgi:dTDP-4-dehydrorhamnose reductase